MKGEEVPIAHGTGGPPVVTSRPRLANGGSNSCEGHGPLRLFFTRPYFINWQRGFHAGWVGHREAGNIGSRRGGIRKKKSRRAPGVPYRGENGAPRRRRKKNPTGQFFASRGGQSDYSIPMSALNYKGMNDAARRSRDASGGGV